MVTGLRPNHVFFIALGIALSTATVVGAQTELPGLPGSEPTGSVTDPIPPGDEQPDPQEEIDEATKLLPGGESPDNAAPGHGGDFGDIGRDVVYAVSDNWMLTGAIAVGVAGAGLLTFFLVNRYVDPRKALENPHRSMLYGFVKGNPGVHLKQLSSEFEMKTSTVLWHIRKLECADLVRSKKANGYRVFYPVSGGLEAKQLSTAVTALSNENARRIFEFIALSPGSQQRPLSERLTINAGTVRWHLKKLRAAGLVAELTKERTGYFYATELGIKAMRQVAGLPPDVKAPTIEVGDIDAAAALA